MRLIRLLKRDLAKECSEWVTENIISEEQAVAICDHYGINYQDASKQTYGYAVLIGLGYLFIGLALITLLSANWDDIPRALRMSGLILVTTGTHLFAFRKYKEGHVTQGIGFFFLGSLFYGASIMLIAQIYHIDEHYPNGIFWWAMGILPLALLLESSLLMSLTAALAFTWFFVEVDLNYYPTLFALFLAALGWHVFKVKQNYVLFLAFIAGVAFWLEYTLAWYMSDGFDYWFDIEHFIFGIGLVVIFHGLGKWLLYSNDHVLKDYGTILSLWVLRFIIIFLLVFSFEDVWGEVIEARWEFIDLVYIISVIMSVIAVVISYIGNNKQYYTTLFFALVFLLGTYATIEIQDDSYAIYFQIITNIVLVIIGIGLIIRGIKEGITHYFFLGVSSILFTAFLRYIDLVGDYIGAAILFIIFAVILLSAARFWKSHQLSKEGT